jgi:hypothetical protein
MRDNGDVRRATQDTPPPPGGLNVNPQSPRTWGLWFGWLTPSGWSFEKAPTPATIIPHLAVFDSGMVAIVSTRLIPPDPPQQTEAQQALYLTYRSPDDQWENSGELLRSSPDPSFTAAVGAPDGVLYVLYGYNGHALYLAIGPNSADAQLLDNDSSPVTHGALAEDAAGRLHAVYGGWGLTHQIFADGQWSVFQTFDNGDYPDLAFDANGVGHLMFLVSRGLNAGYRLMYYRYDPQQDKQWIGGEVLGEVAVQPAPQLAVDSGGIAHVLTPSNLGLLYATCAASPADGCVYEVAAGYDWSAGYEYADLVLPNDEPLAVYRDANTADGFIGHRRDGLWNWDHISGFEDGFIGLDLALDPDGAPELVFAGWKKNSQ